VTTIDNRTAMRSVQDVLDADALAGPPAPAFLRETTGGDFGLAGVPVERYTSRRYLAAEYELLWSRVWQWACCTEDIPTVGSHVVYDIGDRSVVVVRSAADRIQAFHNTCLHRCRRLKTADAGQSENITCGFHGWSWNLDGTLRDIPCRWDFPQVGEADFELPQVRCETWSGFVFVNFDDEASPLLDHLDVLPAHFERFPLADRFTVANVSKVLPLNWKAGMDAFFESYHVPLTHPQLVEFNGDLNAQYDTYTTVSRFISLLAEPSPALGEGYDPVATYEAAAGFFTPPGVDPPPLPPGETPRSAVAGLAREMMRSQLGLDLSATSASEVIDGIEYFVFPNWMPWLGLAAGIQYRWRPNGDDPDSCILDVRLMVPLVPGAPRPPAAPLHRLGPDENFASAPEMGNFGPVLDQDLDNMAAVQRGLKTSVRGTLTFSRYQESRIRHYHSLLDQWVGPNP
jgi:phenylpropionate dioxygenase-like ring-hydroxylating dioxygenase large terminal subunit